MYRLLKVRCVTTNNKCRISLSSNHQTSTKVCSFCRFSHQKIMKSTISFQQCRYRTTEISAAFLNSPSAAKIKRSNERFGELLEVSDDITSNRKTSIKALDADELTMFINQPGMTLKKCQEIRQKLHQLNVEKIQQYESPEVAEDLILIQKAEISSSQKALKNNQEPEDTSLIIEDLQASGLSDAAGLIKNSSYMETLDTAQKVDNEEKTPKKSKEKLTKALKGLKAKPEMQLAIVRAKETNLTSALYAYMQVCLTCGMTAKAYRILMYYRKRANKKGTSQIRVHSARPYNLLLHSYAASINMQKFKEILQMMKKDSIKPTVQTYAAVLEIIGRLKEPETEREFLNTILSEMEKNGLTFHDIVTKACYELDQRKYTIRAIKFVQPDFQFRNDIPDYSYDCRLLKNIEFEKLQVKSSPPKNLITITDIREGLANQLKNELEGEIVIKSIEENDATSSSIKFSRKLIAEYEETWREAVLSAFRRNLTTLKNREKIQMTPVTNIYPYLTVLNEEIFVTAIIQSIRRLANGSETFSPTLSLLCREMGLRINEKYELAEKKRCGVIDKTEEVYMKYSDWYLNQTGEANSRVAWTNIANEAKVNGSSLELFHSRWPLIVQNAIGRFIYDIILKEIKIDVNCIKLNVKEKHYLPAFYTLFRYKGKFLKEEIKPHPILAKLYRESKAETLTFDTTLVPSLCPPKPWSNIHSGGYLISKCNLIRVALGSTQPLKRLEQAPPKKLWPCLDSLNQLASVPWRVNNPVLDIAIKVFREGGSEELNVPQPPSVLPAPPALHANCTQMERTKIAKIRLELTRKKAEMYSLWCDLLYRLSLANHFRDKIFWLPHNMDFRGRVYTIPPHLNHIGSDLARSLLVFAEGKPLGPHGLDWLKIHVINLTGFKKRASIADRLKFANKNMEQILDSARNPLDGKMWWATSDAPWQTLATCMEIAKAVETDDPEKYVSGFPVHQDGSCNGLQHYAALGRDQMGAKNVNLQSCDTPQDVYSNVAEMVDEIRARDAAHGVEIAQILKGFVKRKVIKQTVMTTVYGVTKFGARLQIARQLKDIDGFPQEHVWNASVYLVQTTFESLRSMFESARAIQDWFTECARIISSSAEKHVEWITPLGLPIVQPYCKSDKSAKFAATFQSGIERPYVAKQKNAFAPNFIHSLDSSHMMLTSLYCRPRGVTFISVHDCYWTHACTVDTMNKICREQFVALHSEPILNDLSNFFLQTYCPPLEAKDDGQPVFNMPQKKINSILSSVPDRGTFNLEEVLKSTYFFS